MARTALPFGKAWRVPTCTLMPARVFVGLGQRQLELFIAPSARLRRQQREAARR